MSPRARAIVEASGLFALLAAPLYFVLLARHGVTEGDTLYHFKLASLILREGRPWVDVTWLPYTVLGEHGPDHHWLWHVLLAPFALIPDAEPAIAVAGAATCAATGVVALFVCRGFAIPHPPLAAVVLVGIDRAMPERLTRLRAEDVVYMALPLALLLMAKRRHLALFFLSWAFMESYHGAIFLLPMLAAFAVAEFLSGMAVSLRYSIAVLAGFAAGLIINPWFPRDVDYLLFHTLFKLRSENLDLIGTEWRHPPWNHLVRLSWLVTAVLVSSVVIYAMQRRRRSAAIPLPVETIAALILTAVCFALYLTAYRYGVYYALFAALSALLLWRDSRVRFDASAKAMERAFASVAIAALFCVGLRQVYEVPPDLRSMTRFLPIVSRLEGRVRPEEVVFNIDWTTFTYLLWIDDKVRYVAGLDGNYLAYGDPERFKTWYAIDGGQPIPGGASRAIQSEFGAHWVVAPRTDRADKAAMQIIDGGDAQTVMLTADGWLIHLGSPEP